ncbi:MAG: sugar-binding protein [Owenweeksia sp.]|nr:sugar-binding protein [Owenweeksia sp.]
MPHWLPIALLLSISTILSHGQTKSLPAYRLEANPQIDGKLSDKAWQNPAVPVAQDFVMLDPGNGEPVPNHFRTEVQIFYNDKALYIGAMLYDHRPDSILTQLTERDDFEQNNDWFLLAINPYNDGLSDFKFAVTAAGVKADSRTTADGDDLSWNSVWSSAVHHSDSGWSVEIHIPYMALRFPKSQVKTWGLNMIRNIRRNRTQWSWSYIDRTSGYSREYQAGQWRGVENINPPVRLSLMPYISTYTDNFDGKPLMISMVGWTSNTVLMRVLHWI